MLQVIKELPEAFGSEEQIGSLKADWARLQDGLKSYDEVKDAVRAVFRDQVALTCSGFDESMTGIFDQLKSLSTGTLLVTAEKLIWFNDTEKIGFVVDYPSVILHAVTKTASEEDSAIGENNGRNCLYLQVDVRKITNADGQEFSINLAPKEQEEGEENGETELPEEEEEDDPYMQDDEDLPFVEFQLIVDDVEVIDNMFLAVSDCSALHYDPTSEDEDDEEGFGAEPEWITALEAGEPASKLQCLDDEEGEGGRFDDAIEH